MALKPKEILEAAGEVHGTIGPGFSERIYHNALERELSERGVPFTSEGSFTLYYKGSPVGYRKPDLIVGDGEKFVVELKSNSNSGEEQLESYLQMAENDENMGGVQAGILIQFNDSLDVTTIKV